MKRKNGISVLIPTQNEEAIVGLCILSFLEFGDELIVVDNGSTDRTKEIVRGLASRYPTKIKFFDAPYLPDLYQNRQFAFAKSSYRWVVRADSDYVAYTGVDDGIENFREFLLSQASIPSRPKVYGLPQPNITADFWHTGLEKNSQPGPEHPGRYVPPPFTPGYMLRVYEVFPGFEFVRQGRWEGVRYQKELFKTRVELNYPLWMQCNIKSNRNYLFRSERTNWRQLGDFQRYPSLYSYLMAILPMKYGTKNLDEAACLYLQSAILPFLQTYDPEIYYPYPALVQQQMRVNPIYKIIKQNNKLVRRFVGSGKNDNLLKGISLH